jgi:hypothetical protein
MDLVITHIKMLFCQNPSVKVSILVRSYLPLEEVIMNIINNYQFHTKSTLNPKVIPSPTIFVTTLLLEEWEDDSHTPEMGTWESVGTPKTSEFDFRGQNTFHWGVIYTIGKISKCRCRKWARMSHLDTCSTSYDKKKIRS